MYGLCKDTVTVFRDGEKILLSNCYFQETQVQNKSNTGTWGQRDFLLIVPGDRPIYPGDRVCRGSEEEAMGIIRKVIPYFSDGKLCHREGRGS